MRISRPRSVSPTRSTTAWATAWPCRSTGPRSPCLRRAAPVSGGNTVVAPSSDVTVSQQTSRMFLFEPGVTLAQIVRAVNQVGAAPGDLVAILEALRQAGALRAELIIFYASDRVSEQLAQGRRQGSRHGRRGVGKAGSVYRKDAEKIVYHARKDELFYTEHQVDKIVL